MATLETLTTRFEADIIKFEEKMKQMASSSSRAAERVKKDHDQAADSISKAWKKSDFDGAMRRSVGSADTLRSSLVKIAPALAAAFSVKEAIAAADTYTRFTNSLKVAGLEGTNLATVQEALFASAQKNGVALEPLSQLYGRASQSAKELGASQNDLLKFTDGITAALRVQGGTTEQASGALTQLSQALSGGIIHAEEFNSINEGARPILEAVANGSAKYAGSVSKLRADMLAGKLTSAAFFEAFLAGSSMLEAKAAKAPLTVAASWQVLENALAKAIGGVDQSFGVTERLSGGIKALADHLDLAGEALGVLAGVLGGALVANGGKALAVTVANIAAQETLTGSAAAAALASRGLGAALALVGGPWGIAIMAVAAALGYLAVKGLEAQKATADLNNRIDANYEKLQQQKRAVDDAKEKTGELSGAQLQAAKNAAALTKEVDLLTDAHWRAAAAAKAHALEEIKARVEAAKTDLNDANREKAKETGKVRRQIAGPIGEPGDRAAMGAAASVGINPNAAVNQAVADSEASQKAARAAEVLKAAQAEYAAEAKKSIKDGSYQPPKPTGGTPTTKGAKGRSAADVARSDLAALTQATNQELQAKLANAQTEQERHEVAVEILQYDHNQRLLAIDADKNTSAKAKLDLKAIEEKTYQAQVQKEGIDFQKADLAEQVEARKKRLEAQRADLDASHEIARLQEDILEWQARNAKTIGEKVSFESQALASRQKREKEQIEAEIALLDATGEWAKATQLRAQLPLIDQRQKQETQNQDIQGRRDRGDWGQWATDKASGINADEWNKSLQSVADGGLSSLTDGITSAIMGTKSLGDAFKDTAKQVIADLIRIAVQFLIFESIGRAFGVPGLGKTALKISASGHASGTDSSPGGLKMVGEKGPELLALPQGAQVAPNNLLRNALKAPTATGAKSPVINIKNEIHANDAVLTSDIQSWIYKANMQTLQVARQLTAKDIGRSGNNRLQ